MQSTLENWGHEIKVSILDNESNDISTSSKLQCSNVTLNIACDSNETILDKIFFECSMDKV